MGDVYEVYEDDDQVGRFEVRDLRVKSRFAIDNEFYDEYTPVLGPTLSMVYIALVRHANKEQKTWPSQKRIADQLGVGRQWVSTCLRVLQCFRLIHAVRLGKRCNNRYYLIDQKHWRRDFDGMLKEVGASIKKYEATQRKLAEGRIDMMSPEATSPLGDIRCLRRLHHLLSETTSNSKDKQGKDKQVRRKKVIVKKKSTTPVQEVKEIHLGRGSKIDTSFDEEMRRIVHRHYDD